MQSAIQKRKIVKTRRKIKCSLPFILLLILSLYNHYCNYRTTQDLIHQIEIIKGRRVWMIELTKVFKAYLSDRWTRTQATNAWVQFLEANPDLKVPENFEIYLIQDNPIPWPKIPIEDDTVITK